VSCFKRPPPPPPPSPFASLFSFFPPFPLCSLIPALFPSLFSPRTPQVKTNTELQQLRAALQKSMSDKTDTEERPQKEFERVKADADRKPASQKRPVVFDINDWKDARATAVSRSEVQS
jgi:hypothetical protein